MAKKLKPMPFTEEQMQQVFGTNLIDFAVGNGFVIDEKESDRSAVKIKGQNGLFLFKHGRGFKCFSSDKRGNIIDFVKEYFGLNFINSVEMILGTKAYELTNHIVTPTEKPPKQELVLPPKAESFNRVIAYLIYTRGLDKNIVYQMIKERKIYQSKVDFKGNSYQNCAFVGYDEKQKPMYCALRSPSDKNNFRQDVTGSDKTYGFVMEGKSNRVYEFESPIDAMSHATLFTLNEMDFKSDHRVSEGCLSDKALERYLKLHPEITEIVFCYDNDIDGKLADNTPHNHGQERAKQSAIKFADLGYEIMIQTPNTKDFNSDLKMFRKLLEADPQTEKLEQER